MALVALAAVPRLWAIDLVSITADEGIHGLFAMNTAILHDPPTVGLPSVGVRNSALFIYLLAIPYVFVRHPLAGVAFVSLLNVVAVGLLYRLTREHFGKAAAILATLLQAASPWAVLYARNMWPPSCVGVFALAFLWLSLRWLDEGGRRQLVVMVVLAFVIPQVHFSGFCAPVWLAVVLATRLRQCRVGPMLLGVLLGLATWLPWLHWQHVENQWADVRQIANAARGTATVTDVVPKIVVAFQRLLHSGFFEYWFDIKPSALPEYFSPAGWWGCQLAGVVLTVLFLAALVEALVRGNLATRLLVVWMLLPMGLLMVIRPEIHPHYVLVAYPIPFVLIGRLVGGWLAAGSRWRLGIVVVWLAATLAFHVWFLAGWYRYLNDGRPTGRGHFQLSYRQRRATVMSILDDRRANLRHGIAGNFSGENPGYFWIYHFESLRRGHQNLLPTDDVLYWVDEDSGTTLSPGVFDALRTYRGFGPCRIAKQWRVGPSRILLLERIR